MQDRQHFEVVTLSNGITLYFHPMDVPFFQSRIIVPVGSAHSHKDNGGLPGISHFLEHLTFERSKRYPAKYEFEQLVHQNGGYLNATTYAHYTDYILMAAAEDFSAMFLGQYDQVFNPIFAPEDIAIQRGIISNERNRRKYYPGKTELGKYLLTKWMNLEMFSLRQLFGLDEDLDSMTVKLFTDFHQHYFSSNIRVIVGGTFDRQLVEKTFSELPIIPQSKTIHIQSPAWVRKEYHQEHFKDLNSPSLWYGNFTTHADITLSWLIDFLGEYLTNHTSGPLNQWLRKEKGWTYGLGFSHWAEADRMIWRFEFPVNQLSHVDEIRDQLSEKMKMAVSDEVMIRQEVTRRLKEQLFVFQTLSSRIDMAVGVLGDFGQIFTEADHRLMLENLAKDPSQLLSVYEQYLAPEVCGSVLALPEKLSVEN